MNEVWVLIHHVDYESDTLMDIFAEEERGVVDLMEVATGRSSTPPPAAGESRSYCVPTPGGRYSLTPWSIIGA